MVQILGASPRGEVDRHYQWADLFLFPTFSDGFGLTQLEAQAWKLPIITSRFCGDVVQHGRNGYLLDQVSGEEIAQSIRNVLQEPESLAITSAASGIGPQFTLTYLAERLNSLVAAPAMNHNV